jgi:hypothetical protein
LVPNVGCTNLKIKTGIRNAQNLTMNIQTAAAKFTETAANGAITSTGNGFQPGSTTNLIELAWPIAVAQVTQAFGSNPSGNGITSRQSSDKTELSASHGRMSVSISRGLRAPCD